MRVITEELQKIIIRIATPYPPPQNLGTDDDVSDLEEIEEGEVATDTQGIETDASDKGIGACILQQDEEEK